jgi:hypothetical protein
MATNKGNENGTTRRGFIAAIGVASAAGMLPAQAQASSPTVWGSARAMLPSLTGAYLAEVARFTESIRDQLLAGELRANTSDDWESGYEETPFIRLENAGAEHFGVAVKRTRTPDGWETLEGDERAAHLVLLASPSTEATDDSANHACYQAAEAIVRDVLACARRHGWTGPAEEDDL